MMPSLRFVGVVLFSLACLTGGQGCSLMFAKGPPKRPAPHQVVRCTTSYNLSILDGLIAAFNSAGVLYLLTTVEGESQSVNARTTGVAFGIVYAGLYTISMAVGIDRVGRCREVLDAMARAQAEEEDEDEDEDEENDDEVDVAERAKAAGKAAPAPQSAPEPPTVTPQGASGQ